MQEEQLLNEYKKYDYLNQDKNNPLVKIFVSYIKPSFLFKSEILTPIHLGCAVEKENSKDGKITEDDINWLHENCIGDDDFEGNISHVNRRVGFLTGTYWAWKNYEKLGNPEYFGSFGYRRLFDPEFLSHIENSNADIILPKKRNLNIESIKEQFINYHGQKLFDKMFDIFSKTYPNETQNLSNYFNQTSGYFDEIYVMKKECFFKFCEWIFPLLFEYLKTSQTVLPNNDLRDIGFIIERLTGYHLEQLTTKYKLRYYETNIITTQKMIVNRANINADLLAKLRKKL